MALALWCRQRETVLRRLASSDPAGHHGWSAVYPRRGGRDRRPRVRGSAVGRLRHGQAVAHLSVQARHERLAAHQLGGFDRDQVAALLAAPGEVTPLVVLAVGRRDDAVQLAEPFASRETAARDRLPLDQVVLSLQPASAAA